jgi:hypothetical protein
MASRHPFAFAFALLPVTSFRESPERGEGSAFALAFALLSVIPFRESAFPPSMDAAS